MQLKHPSGGNIRANNYKHCATLREAFGTADAKGRAIGAMVVLSNGEYENPDVFVGRVFGFRPQATRDGDSYGALQNERWFATVTERDAEVTKYLANARKRASKTA
jgi:hypothetical protein